MNLIILVHEYRFSRFHIICEYIYYFFVKHSLSNIALQGEIYGLDFYYFISFLKLNLF